MVSWNQVKWILSKFHVKTMFGFYYDYVTLVKLLCSVVILCTSAVLWVFHVIALINGWGRNVQIKVLEMLCVAVQSNKSNMLSSDEKKCTAKKLFLYLRRYFLRTNFLASRLSCFQLRNIPKMQKKNLYSSAIRNSRPPTFATMFRCWPKTVGFGCQIL